MTFLNPALLGGVAAAAVPLIFHLLNRRRFRTVRWGAMMFLEDILRTNRRRVRIEQWILLLVRMGIPALLALAMARPVLTGAPSLAGRAPSSVVILFDNSFSMEAGDAGRSALAAAKEQARQIAAAFPRGSEAAVLGMAGPLPRTEEPTVDRPQLLRGIDDIDGGYGAARVAASLQQAAGLFEGRLHHADRLLLIVSDFQRSSWAAHEAEERRRAWERLAGQPVPPRIVLLPVPAGDTDNLAVGPIELARGLVGVGHTLKFRVSARHHGRRPRRAARVHLRVDGADRAASSVRLEPGETESILFTHVFDRPGSHVIEARLDDDSLRADNTAAAAVTVVDRIPVLLVTGDPNPAPLRGETAFLELALQPFSGRAGRMSDLLAARTVEESKVSAALLREVRAVVLANVRQLPAEFTAALGEFVRDGGGLLICPGDRVNAGWYRSALDEREGLLPAALAGIEGRPDDDANAVALASQRYVHPTLAVFNDPAQATLGGVRIRAWHRLELPPERAADVAARLDNGAPLLAERRAGRGAVMMFCVPCDADWSNLPFRPAYVPLMQEVIVHLASTVHPPRNVETGEHLAVFFDAGREGDRVTVALPDGTAREAALAARGRRWMAEFGETDRPGVYTMRPPGDGEPVHFAVRPPREESDLARLSDAELAALATEASATVARSAEEFLQNESERRYGRELWRAAW